MACGVVFPISSRFRLSRTSAILLMLSVALLGGLVLACDTPSHIGLLCEIDKDCGGELKCLNRQCSRPNEPQTPFGLAQICAAPKASESQNCFLHKNNYCCVFQSADFPTRGCYAVRYDLSPEGRCLCKSDLDCPKPMKCCELNPKSPDKGFLTCTLPTADNQCPAPTQLAKPLKVKTSDDPDTKLRIATIHKQFVLLDHQPTEAAKNSASKENHANAVLVCCQAIAQMAWCAVPPTHKNSPTPATFAPSLTNKANAPTPATFVRLPIKLAKIAPPTLIAARLQAKVRAMNFVLLTSFSANRSSVVRANKILIAHKIPFVVQALLAINSVAPMSRTPKTAQALAQSPPLALIARFPGTSIVAEKSTKPASISKPKAKRNSVALVKPIQIAHKDCVVVEKGSIYSAPILVLEVYLSLFRKGRPPCPSAVA